MAGPISTIELPFEKSHKRQLSGSATPRGGMPYHSGLRQNRHNRRHATGPPIRVACSTDFLLSAFQQHDDADDADDDGQDTEQRYWFHEPLHSLSSLTTRDPNHRASRDERRAGRPTPEAHPSGPASTGPLGRMMNRRSILIRYRRNDDSVRAPLPVEGLTLVRAQHLRIGQLQ